MNNAQKNQIEFLMHGWWKIVTLQCNSGKNCEEKKSGMNERQGDGIFLVSM